jgi:hypothetical protein
VQERPESKSTPDIRLWEGNIVLALRDMQWRGVLSHWENRSKRTPAAPGAPLPSIPPGIVKNDGNVEPRLGDLALDTGNRLFLIEVKSTAKQVNEEWSKAKPKQLYKRLEQTLALSQCRDHRQAEAQLMLQLSLRGHLMAFWDPGSKAGSVRPGVIEVLPYLKAVVDQCKDAPRATITALPYPYIHTYKDPDELHDPNLYRMVASEIANPGFRVASLVTEGGHFHRWDIGPLGLNADEFQRYVDFLMRRDEQDASTSSTETEKVINCVVQNDYGDVFQVITDTTQLSNLVRFSPRKTLQEIMQGHKEQQSGVVFSWPQQPQLDASHDPVQRGYRQRRRP